MNAIAVVFLRITAPAVGVLLALLGVSTSAANFLGWFLFITGVLYAAGTIIATYVLKRDAGGDQAAGGAAWAEDRNRGSWSVSAGMLAVFFLAPLEFIYLRAQQPPLAWLEFAGACLAVLGAILWIWAHRSLHTRSRQNAAKGKQPLPQSGPYRIIRHPAYAAYLLACMGLALGYGSVAAAMALLLLLLPAALWRIAIEEHRLSAQLGRQYEQYASGTKRLIPGLW